MVEENQSVSAPAPPELDDDARVPTVSVSQNPTADAEANFFGTTGPDDDLRCEIRRKEKLKNDRQEQDNKLSKQYAARAYRFSKTWVIFLMVFIPTQMYLNYKHVGLSDTSFVAVVGSLSASVLGYWWLVGRYLFPSNPK